MYKTVVALYDDVAVAQRAIEKLVSNGFTRDNISLLANDASNDYSHYLDRYGTGETVDAVTASDGAGFGATVGALTGVLVGLGAFMIPGVGPIIGAGPLIAGLTGGVVGAVAGGATGGLVGGLVKTGVAPEDAEYYAEGVRRGGTLVVVHTPDSLSQRVRDILNEYHPVDINTRLTEWQQSGWKAFDPTAKPYTASEIKTFRSTERPLDRTTVNTATQTTAPSAYGFDRYDEDFRNHFRTNLSSSGYTYDQMLPVYRYGYDLANNDRYVTSDWTTAEPEARRSWESRNPGNSWDKFKDAIRFAWDRVRGKDTAYTR
ncbi:MAG: general stress protein [Chloroflexota bacterium]